MTVLAGLLAVAPPSSGTASATSQAGESAARSTVPVVVSYGAGPVPESAPQGAADHLRAAKVAQDEAAEQWTSTTHVKRLPNGNSRLEVFTEPTFRRGADGWKPLSADVQQRGNRAFAPGSARPLVFGASAADLVTMDLGSGPVKVAEPGLSIGSPSVQGSVATYSNVATDTDMRLEALTTGYREEYVLGSHAAPLEFVSEIVDPEHRLGDPQRQNDGSYAFSTVFPDGLQMTLAAPYAYEEAAGPTTADHSAVRMTVDVTAKGYRVVKTLDTAWAMGAAFPVVLDPTAVWVPDLSRGYAADGWAPRCATIFSNPYGPFYNNDATLRSGWTSPASDGYFARTGTRAFIGIEMPLPPGTRIISALLDLAWYADTPGNGANSRYEILKYLEPLDTVQNGCRLTNGATSPTGSSSTAAAADWYITSLVQEWVNDPSSNNGMIIAPTFETTTQDIWSSSHGPRLPALIIEYVGDEQPLASLNDQQVTGTPCVCATVDPSMYRADPVNTNTGRLVESITDVEVSGGPLPLQIRRSFDSGATASGALGIGWTHKLETSVHYDDATGYALVDTGAGNKIGFARQPDGTFLPDVGVTADLAQDSTGFTLSMPSSGVTSRFTTAGLLSSITGEDSGYQLTAVHNAAGELVTVTDTDGKALTFTYTAGLVHRVTLDDGRYVEYGYTGGRLTSVRALSGTVTTYRYDASGNLDQVSTGDRTVTNTYDQDTGRLLSQQDGEGNTTTFEWDSATQTATTRYPGGGVATDVYSGNFLIRSTDRSGAMMRFTYDSNGQVATATDPLGRVTTMSYDPLTRLLAQRVGPPPHSYRELWTYDADGRLLTSTDRDGKVTTYTYDAAGQVQTISDPLGRATTFTYDAEGRTDTITGPRAGAPGANPADFRTSFAYDANGYPRTTTDPLARVSTTLHNPQGQLTAVTDGEGGTASFSYATSGRLQSATEPRGNVTGAVAADYTTTSTYNVHGELETSTNAAGGVTRYTYDRAGQLKTVTDPLLRVTSYDHDVDGNVIRTTDPAGAATTYTYDHGGRRTSMTTPRGNALPAADRGPYTWTYTYDAAGNQTQVFNPLTGPTRSTYDEYGRKTSVSTPYKSGDDSYGGTRYTTFVTRTAYDGRGNVVSETDQYGGVTTHTYDAAGQLTASTSPRGNLPGANAAAYTTRYEYDLAGHQTAVIDPLGNKTTYQYDNAGQLTAVTDPRGNATGANPTTYTTTYGYDRAGKQTRVTNPMGAVATSKYDAAGNLIAVTDPRGNVTGASAQTYTTSYGIDRLGRVETETAPGGALTRYGFDAVGNTLTHTDANNHTTTYTYDAANRPLTRTSPTGQVWGTTYNPDGQVAAQTNPAGSATALAGDGTTTFERDPLGQVTRIDYSDTTPDVTYTYMLDGRPKSATTSAGFSLSYEYADWGAAAPGSLWSVTTSGDAQPLHYDHDALGFLVKRWSADAAGASLMVDYAYDALGRVSTVGTGAAAVALGYDAAGNLATLTEPATNGYTETRAYDPAGRMSTVTNKRGTATLSSYTQTYDPASNPAALTIVNGGTTTQTAYTYDPAGRLTAACYAATCASATAKLAYSYDPVGNRQSEVRTGVTPPGTTTYAYDNADQLQTTTTGATVTRYAYDPNGNQTAAGARTFSYDLANRLTSTKAGSTTTSYTYDADGNRRTQALGNAKTTYTWDLAQGLPQLAHETGAKGAIAARYTYTPSGEPLTLTTPAGTFYYHHDQLGSVSNITNTAGVTQASYTYEPFGGQRTAVLASKAPANQVRFAGQYLDTTGLYNLRARLYNPTIGQFTSLDPAVTSTGQPYAYANQSPLRYTDPGGLWSCAPGDTWCDIAQMGVGELRGLGDLYYRTMTVQGWEDTIQAIGDRCGATYADALDATLNCVDALNPIAGIRDDFGRAWQNAEAGCYLDAGRQLSPAIVGTASLFLPFTKAPVTAGPAAAAESGGMAGVRAAGTAGERAAGIVKNTDRIPSASGTAAYRIPDELNATTLGEVKNVSSLSYTNQLRDFQAYAQQTGRAFNLYVRGSTTFSGPLQDAINAGQINVIRNLSG